MTRVLICTPDDLQEKLRQTLLWRTEVERPAAPDAEAILAIIRERRPRLLIVDGRGADATDLIFRIREDQDIRDISIAALFDGSSEERAVALRKAGANVVLSEWQSTPLWDDAFQELLNVPPRRWITFPVTLTIGARLTTDSPQLDAVARNVSVRGLLMESPRSIPTGTVINIFFTPGGPPELHLVARIVWEKTADQGKLRQGVEFLGFHGDALSRIAAFVAAGGTPGGAAPNP
jgi:hypothetical protein